MACFVLLKAQFVVCVMFCRANIYLEGGVLFITTRILVVDMLVERIPVHLVSGILVYKAHKYVHLLYLNNVQISLIFVILPCHA